MRDYEYQLLDAIADNPTVTQAGLAAQLGVAVLARRTAEYMEQSLVVYRKLRSAAMETAVDIQSKGIECVLLQGDSDATDILRLTLLEYGVVSTSGSADWLVRCVGHDYYLESCDAPGANNRPHGSSATT